MGRSWGRAERRGCTTESLYRSVLDQFPTGRCLVFAYGSGVFQQAGRAPGEMTDFIFGVDDAAAWHRENLARHPSHYSGLARAAGPDRVARLQDNTGARLYFNTLVPWGSGKIKYGVATKAALLADLTHWQTLYLAGRLHKPVKLLECGPDLAVPLAANLVSALRAALLLLPASFTEEELLLAVAGLSYTGDFRMVVGEDRGKVRAIVTGNRKRFSELYRPAVAGAGAWLQAGGGGAGLWEQDCSPAARLQHLLALPAGLLDQLCPVHIQQEEKLEQLANEDCSVELHAGLTSLVAATDKSQAVKGIITAGPVKATVYSLAKLKKMWRSLR